MVGHSIRGKKTGSDSEETHPSTRYTAWCNDSQKTHPMCSVFGPVHRKHTQVRVLLLSNASEIKFLKIQPDSREWWNEIIFFYGYSSTQRRVLYVYWVQRGYFPFLIASGPASLARRALSLFLSPSASGAAVASRFLSPTECEFPPAAPYVFVLIFLPQPSFATSHVLNDPSPRRNACLVRTAHNLATT
jgi:hypothetical protein